MIEADDSVCLLQLLNSLVFALESNPFVDPGAEARRETVPQRWEDKDHVYYEANLFSAAESEIDISIHRGRIFIRIVR